MYCSRRFLKIRLLIRPNVDIGKPLKDIAPYPAAAENQTRYVIRLPEKPHEENMKVQIRAVKNVMKDPVNRVFLNGNFEEKTILGWGYDYYVISEVAGAGKTQVGYEGEETLQPVGVRLGHKAFLKYNSKLPIVVYTPKDVTLHYVIWTANDEIQNASEE